MPTTSNSYNIIMCRPCQPNWDYQEIFVLINVNNNNLVRRDVIDSKNQFEYVVYKWWKITDVVNESIHTIQLNNVIACKDKWGIIYTDKKWIFDYMSSRTKTSWITNSSRHKTLQQLLTFQWIRTSLFMKWSKC